MLYKYSQLEERLPYEETKKMGCQDATRHLGQLKLLLTETMFLSKTYNYGKKVLYVGAAHGYHIYKLAKMFPMLKFDLWDPGQFNIKEHPNIKIFNHFFTNEAAQSYKDQGKDLLFISDIRNLEIASNRNNIKILDKIIEEDNKKQIDWLRIIKPVYAFLKFRLGYLPGKSKHLTGKIYMQPYSPYSTESRLYTRDYDTIINYDNLEFDEKMAYFNCKIRDKSKYDYWSDVLKQNNLKNNWDNNLALFILKHYLEKVHGIINNNNSVSDLFMEIYRFFNKKYGDKYDNLFNNSPRKVVNAFIL